MVTHVDNDHIVGVIDLLEYYDTYDFLNNVFIGYFILFVMLFIQCTKSILMIKMSSDVKRNGYIISEINKDFLKKTMKEQISKKAIDLLRRDLANLRDVIQVDDNTELQVELKKPEEILRLLITK